MRTAAVTPRLSVMLRRTTLFLSILLIAAAAHAQSSYRLVVPAAGDVAGANGTHFRSDISITNNRDVAQRVQLRWLSRNGQPDAAQSPAITIQPRGTIRSDNFVAEYIHAAGLGALEIVAVNDNNQIDEGGLLYATSRIWSNQPGASGTVSQSLPVQRIQEIVHQHIAFTGHPHGGQYRTNLGLVNLLTDVTQTFRVNVTGSVQTAVPVIFDVTVKPYGMEQVPIDWPEYPQLRVDVQVLPQPGGGLGTLWTAYLSSIDNLTGDSWSTLGVELEDL